MSSHEHHGSSYPSPHDPLPDPEPAVPSLPEPDPGVFHHQPIAAPPKSLTPEK